MNGNRMMKGLSLMLAVLLAAFSAGGVFVTSARAENASSVDKTYDSDWNDPTLVLNENTVPGKTNITVKISGVTHTNQGSTGDTNSGAAILIRSGMTVHLIIEGNVTLTGNPNIIGAGIEVENGATLDIYGSDGSSLTVTGGKYSAGIGGKGYQSGSENNPSPGTINIHSGKIVAIGGVNSGGAGIGSGYHSSASVINISGGDITALGRGYGAGIGSGYGTSGGSTGPKSGYYTGGQITISGGTVRAAAWQFNFDDFDPYNPEALYDPDYQNTYAAGIGGGYGASSGTIVIEGNADVTAIGSCGGAGIGSGRGTSKMINYDGACKPVDITIRGNAKVTAISTRDTRTTGDTVYKSGAAIGMGHGMGGKKDDTCKTGSVQILGNAEVYAWAGGEANAIGTGWPVTKFEKNTNGQITPYPPKEHKKSLDTLVIDSTCTVVAISDGTRSAIDEKLAIPAGMTVVASDGNSLFGLNLENTLFTAVPTATGTKSNVKIPVTSEKQLEYAVQLPGNTGGLYFLDSDGVRVLTNKVEDLPWQFPGGVSRTISNLINVEYDITYHPNGGTLSADDPTSYSTLGPQVTLPVLTQERYDFLGWYDNEKLTGDPVTVIPVGSTDDKEFEFWAGWSVNQHAITITGASQEWTYDGAAHSNTAVTVTKGMLYSGDTISASAAGKVTNVADTADGNNPVAEGYKVMNGDTDMTAFYTITPVAGTLTIKAKDVAVTAQDKAFVYTGAAQSWPEYDVEGLVGDDRITAVVTGSITYPSESPVTNKVDSYAFTSGTAGNYAVTTADGKLTMTGAEAAITITAASQEWTYDGEAHSNTAVTVTEGQLLSGDTLSAVATGSVTEVADTKEGNNPIAEGYKVVHGETDVTANYAITAVAGTLTISPAETAVTAAPEAKTNLVYTGNPQELITPGTAAQGGTMQYVLGTDDKAAPETGWSTGIPKGTEAGTYYVWYKAAGDGNHKDSTPVCVKVTIKAPDIAYSVVNGADHTVGDGQDAVITVERNYEDQKTYGLYTGADMDGTALPAGSYSTAQGSLILTLKAAYLDTLEVGSHQLTISFRDGKATATLHIRVGEATPTPTPAEPTETPKPVPKTGDDGNLVLWIGLVLLGLIGIGGMAVTKRKSRT